MSGILLSDNLKLGEWAGREGRGGRKEENKGICSCYVELNGIVKLKKRGGRKPKMFQYNDILSLGDTKSYFKDT